MNIGLFFGAGAEISYGLPSGGKFALDIFKAPVSDQKQRLKDDLKKIDIRSLYAREWLPTNIPQKPVYAFGKSEFSSLLQSSIEYKSENILRNLSDFDNICDEILKSNAIEEDLVAQLYRDEFNREFGELTYEESVKLNKLLTENNESKNIFSSKFYSSILDCIERKNNSLLKKYATAILQLFVCVIGQKVVKNLNQDLFERNETNLSIFDDLTTNFNMDFSRLGVTILDIVLDNQVTDINKDNIESFLSSLFGLAITKIFEECLDYRKLIDEHFRYLFSPKTQWAKFSKMVIFLRTVHEYIKLSDKNLNIEENGYYHDLVNSSKPFNINAVGTSNYNMLISSVLNNLVQDIKYLNGSVRTFYNPYKNTLIRNNDDITLDDNGQIVVPFILTQSGLKPFTAIDVSQDYVYLYQNYLKSDIIICVGFGFNSDDNHINGIFGKLVEKGKKLVYVTKSDINIDKIKEDVKNKLRVKSEYIKNIDVLNVDVNRTYDNKLWLDYVLDR